MRRRALQLATALLLAYAAPAAPALLPEPDEKDMLVWMDARFAPREFVAVHAERAIGNDPANGWEAVTKVYQPFRSGVDRERRQAWWRKDNIRHDFYGEIFGYDRELVSLRMESFPIVAKFGEQHWDIREDKFRLFVMGGALDARRYGQGRPIAPRLIRQGWERRQTVNTFICYSWAEFEEGTCRPFQQGVRDRVTITVEAPFSTVYDGTMAGWPASPPFTSFDMAVIVNQSMNDGAARERFIFARKDGRYYGIVRWDLSLPMSGTNGDAGGWKVVRRTTGLETCVADGGPGTCSKPLAVANATFSTEGIAGRTERDFFRRGAGLRIVESGGRTAACPHTMETRGTFRIEPNSGSWHAEVRDLAGARTLAGGTGALCVDPAVSDVRLTTARGCPKPSLRGTFFVAAASVARSPSELAPVAVANDWVALCAVDASRRDAYLRLAPESCGPGTAQTSAFMPHRDCQDEAGRRCGTQPPGGSWMALCSR